MRLLGRKTSVNVQKVLWAIEELGISCEREDLGGMYGGLDTADYAAINPNRRVPALIDSDLVMWESNAILRYLCSAYGGGALAGATAVARARADMWMEWFQNNCYAHFIGIFYQTVRLPVSLRDPGELNRLRVSLGTNFELLNTHLTTHRYVAGDHFSMGDIVVGASLYRYYTMEIDRPDLPELAAYYSRLEQRTPYRDSVMTSYESLRPKD